MIAALLLAVSIDAQRFPDAAEDLAHLRVTPAIPDGQPFQQSIDLPGDLPDPAGLSLLMFLGGRCLLRRGK